MMKCLRYLLLLVILHVVLFSAVNAQSKIGATTSSIENSIKSYTDFLRHSGFSGQLFLANGEKVHLNTALGLANRETLKPVSNKTLFNIGSIAKPITATAILLLEQQAKLKLTDSVGMFWNFVPTDIKSITIHQLLTHTSGLPRTAAETVEHVSKPELLKRIFALTLKSKPGSSFRYSNAGYELLAAIIETVSGMSYYRYVRQNILVPCAMKNTLLYGEQMSDRLSDIAIGYNEWKEVSYAGLQLQDKWNGTGSANIISNATDLYLFFRALQTGILLHDTRYKKMCSPHTKTDDDEEYGYGWFLTTTATGKRLLYHGGDISGYRTEFRYYPEGDYTIIVLTNQEIHNRGIFRRVIASNLSKFFSHTEAHFPQQTIALRQEVASAYCGIYGNVDNEYIKIWMNGTQLTMGAFGKKVVALCTASGSITKPNADSVFQLTTQLMDALTHNNDSIAQQILSKEDYTFYYQFLKKKFSHYEQALEGFDIYTIVGCIPAYWVDEGASLVCVKITFGFADCTIYIGWKNNRINDVRVNDSRPFPLIFPVVFRTAQEGFAYDADNTSIVEMKFGLNKQHEPENLMIKNAKGEKVWLAKIK